MIEAVEIRRGVFIARRYCGTIADHVEAYRARYCPRFGINFPTERIEADSVDALNAALQQAGWRKVWA
ncbi:hypothetical protein [Phaeobacter phage MD18]|nr:hypothetical protein [Phaeobacter phage MD18]